MVLDGGGGNVVQLPLAGVSAMSALMAMRTTMMLAILAAASLSLVISRLKKAEMTG